jgi:hypothetical protein
MSEHPCSRSIFNWTGFVHFIFMILVGCDVCYNFRIKTMFCSSLFLICFVQSSCFIYVICINFTKGIYVYWWSTRFPCLLTVTRDVEQELLIRLKHMRSPLVLVRFVLLNSSVMSPIVCLYFFGTLHCLSFDNGFWLLLRYLVDIALSVLR